MVQNDFLLSFVCIASFPEVSNLPVYSGIQHTVFVYCKTAYFFFFFFFASVCLQSVAGLVSCSCLQYRQYSWCNQEISWKNSFLQWKYAKPLYTQYLESTYSRLAMLSIKRVYFNVITQYWIPSEALCTPQKEYPPRLTSNSFLFDYVHTLTEHSGACAWVAWKYFIQYTMQVL